VTKKAAFGASLLAVGLGVGWLVWRLTRPGLRRPRRVEPIMSDLLAEHAGRVDYADAWAAPIADGESGSPADWAHAIVAFPPTVDKLMRLRDALVRPFGLATMMDQDLPYTGFPLLAEGEGEAVLGADDKHLNFRVGVDTHSGQVTFTTTVTVNNRLGKVYWAFVRWCHPVLVAYMLRQARVTTQC
jgi:hypothetical protein